jgi:bacterioferritin-associated ferredoxin
MKLKATFKLVPMIICSCKAVSDRDVHDAIDAGADSAAAVGHMCGAGTGCGACVRVVEHVLEQRRGAGCARGGGGGFVPIASASRVA